MSSDIQPYFKSFHRSRIQIVSTLFQKSTTFEIEPFRQNSGLDNFQIEKYFSLANRKIEQIRTFFWNDNNVLKLQLSVLSVDCFKQVAFLERLYHYNHFEEDTDLGKLKRIKSLAIGNCYLISCGITRRHITDNSAKSEWDATFSFLSLINC